MLSTLPLKAYEPEEVGGHCACIQTWITTATHFYKCMLGNILSLRMSLKIFMQPTQLFSEKQFRSANKHTSLNILPHHYPIVGENLLASVKEYWKWFVRKARHCGGGCWSHAYDTHAWHTHPSKGKIEKYFFVHAVRNKKVHAMRQYLNDVVQRSSAYVSRPVWYEDEDPRRGLLSTSDVTRSWLLHVWTFAFRAIYRKTTAWTWCEEVEHQ